MKGCKFSFTYRGPKSIPRGFRKANLQKELIACDQAYHYTIESMLCICVMLLSNVNHTMHIN